jgi:hypothetical protein
MNIRIAFQYFKLCIHEVVNATCLSGLNYLNILHPVVCIVNDILTKAFINISLTIHTTGCKNIKTINI